MGCSCLAHTATSLTPGLDLRRDWKALQAIATPHRSSQVMVKLDCEKLAKKQKRAREFSGRVGTWQAT